jgi:hypothetical protein
MRVALPGLKGERVAQRPGGPDQATTAYVLRAPSGNTPALLASLQVRDQADRV